MSQNQSSKPVYLSLGSNLGERLQNLHAAVEALRREISVTSISSLYETAPVGVTDQPEFLNLALGGQTSMSPHDLLASAKRIEREIGRMPGRRWGPRVVDVDILLYGDDVLADDELTIPHREMANRAFVLMPLAQIAPDVKHPRLERTIRELRDEVVDADSGVRLVSPPPEW